MYCGREKVKGVPHHAKAGNINSALLKEGPGKVRPRRAFPPLALWAAQPRLRQPASFMGLQRCGVTGLEGLSGTRAARGASPRHARAPRSPSLLRLPACMDPLQGDFILVLDCDMSERRRLLLSGGGWCHAQLPARRCSARLAPRPPPACCLLLPPRPSPLLSCRHAPHPFLSCRHIPPSRPSPPVVHPDFLDKAVAHFYHRPAPGAPGATDDRTQPQVAPQPGSGAGSGDKSPAEPNGDVGSGWDAIAVGKSTAALAAVVPDDLDKGAVANGGKTGGTGGGENGSSGGGSGSRPWWPFWRRRTPAAPAAPAANGTADKAGSKEDKEVAAAGTAPASAAGDKGSGDTAGAGAGPERPWWAFWRAPYGSRREQLPKGRGGWVPKEKAAFIQTPQGAWAHGVAGWVAGRQDGVMGGVRPLGLQAGRPRCSLQCGRLASHTHCQAAAPPAACARCASPTPPAWPARRTAATAQTFSTSMPQTPWSTAPASSTVRRPGLLGCLAYPGPTCAYLSRLRWPAACLNL